MQDAGGDIVALCDNSGSITGAPFVAAQWTYDAYGAVFSADHLAPHPFMHAGHKGLFFDRLDVGVADTGVPGSDGGVVGLGAAGETPRLVPFAHAIYHNRNRAYNPQFGRFMQADPNASGLALLEASSYNGQSTDALTVAFNLTKRFGDGANLYEYLGSNPWNRSDPMGLSWDPFDMVDDYMEETAAERSAFLSAVGQGTKAVAIVAATIASYLPIPVASFAGELALAALNGESPDSILISASIGLVPGGKLMRMANGFASRIGHKAVDVAAGYLGKFGGLRQLSGSRLFTRAKTAMNDLARWMKGKADTVVYLGMVGAKAVYVGITSQTLEARLRQHKQRGKPFDNLQGITSPLPRSMAMAVETVLIMSNPHFMNKRLTGQNNPTLDEAASAGTKWLRRNNVPFVY